MPIGSSFICFLAFWHVTHTEVYSLTPLKFNLGWLNTHVEVYITIIRRLTAPIFPHRFSSSAWKHAT